MALADDIVEAAAKALYLGVRREFIPWGALHEHAHERYRDMARDALSTALDTLAQAQDDIHDHGGIRPMDLEALAVLVREGTR